MQPLRDKMGDVMITDLANELLLKVAKDKFHTYLIYENCVREPIIYVLAEFVR